MSKIRRTYPKTAIRCVSGTLKILFLLTPSTIVLAHGGHGDEFIGGNETAETGSVNVDAQTAQRLGIKVEPVKRQRLAVGIKTTGQIETLPNKLVEVTTPISGVKVVELLVEPGAIVKKVNPLRFYLVRTW